MAKSKSVVQIVQSASYLWVDYDAIWADPDV